MQGLSRKLLTENKMVGPNTKKYQGACYLLESKRI